MRQRAISLLVSTAAVSTAHATFSLALQVAASRAWTRRVSTYTSTPTIRNLNYIRGDGLSMPSGTTGSSSGRFTSPYTSNSKPPSPSIEDCLQNRASPPMSSDRHHTLPNLTNKASISLTTDLCNEFRFIKKRTVSSSLDDSSSISDTSQTSHHPCPEAESSSLELIPKPPQLLAERTNSQSLSRPKTMQDFHLNMLQLIYHTNPPFPLPAVVDYHNLYPELHSTRSYNALLALTLQHTAFATFRSLLQSMRGSRVGRNLETWKLEVRYLVQTGSWDQAWTRVNELRRSNRSQAQEQPIPTPIWLEFFRLPGRGAPPKPRYADEKGQEASKDDTRLSLNSPRIRQPDPWLWNHRLKLLFASAPKDVIRFRNVNPVVIRGIVSFLLRLQHREQALLVTKSFIQALPEKLSAKEAGACTSIINLHVALHSPDKGLGKLWNTKKLLASLLRLHPDIRPDPSTLFLLLAPLRHAKQCGAAAKSVTQEFAAKWGAEVLDEKVKRRVVSLALKEGRLDIAEEYMKCKDQPLPGGATTSDDRRLERVPRKILFPGSGKERQLWHRLQRRANGLKDTLK